MEARSAVDFDTLWRGLGGGALVAAALTVARLLLEFGARAREHRFEREERRRSHQRDAEARLERILQDRLSDADRRLADADRRLERCEMEAQAERVRAAVLEREHARLVQAHAQLGDQYAELQAQYTLLLRQLCGPESARGPS
jgi:hypothetical protein